MRFSIYQRNGTTLDELTKNVGRQLRNNNNVENDQLNITLTDFNNQNFLKLSCGKKNHVIIKII